MESKDLRIGNLLIDKEFPTLYSEIEMIRSNGVLIGSYDEGQHIEHFEPIPLTEEWLVKFGFGVGEFDNEMIKPEGTRNAVPSYTTEEIIAEAEKLYKFVQKKD